MEMTGKLSLNILDGTDWILTHINRQQPLPGDAEVTLSFNAGRISGRSACNRYSADVREGDKPGDILIGPTMGTRMACPDHLMEVESLYLKALAQVTSFSFFSGSLALNGQNEEGKAFSLLSKPAGKEQN
jgi:heat shock protein HslJ